MNKHKYSPKKVGKFLLEDLLVAGSNPPRVLKDSMETAKNHEIC